MSVVGIDIGYQSCYIGIARHGGIEVITNEYSERSSPSIVVFDSKQRSMSTSAKTKSVSNVTNTVMGFKNLVGRSFSDPVVQEEIKRQYCKFEQLPNDKIGIKVNYLDEEHVFSPEQITAMMLTYLKGVAAKALEKPVTDCVISVPSFFTDCQRRAMLDSCTMAGLNCLRLINETTAVALAYGIYKQDLPEEKEKSRNVVFVDMGHNSLQVSVCAFNKGKLKVLAKAFDPYLGGKDFDRRMLVHFAEEFKTKYKVDALSRSRQTMRLTAECEKLRKLMSTNTQSIPMNIECFMDDKDVSGRMKREEFEELCKDLLERVSMPILAALKKSGLKVNDIYAVELVGGCTRIPAVKKIISDIFQREPSTTLNQDEAVSKGCALQCAILSPTFKVRDFSIHDTTPYPIQLLWTVNDEPGDMIIFNEGDQIYHSKILSFYRREPFLLTAKYSDPKNLPHPSVDIGKFFIKDVKPTEENESSKIKVKVRLSIHGTFFIKSATLIEKQVAEEMEVEQAKTETEAQNGEQTETQPTEQTKTQTAEQTETQTTEQTETQTVESSNSDTSLPDGTDGGGANNDQQQPMDTQPDSQFGEATPQTEPPTEGQAPPPAAAATNTDSGDKTPAAKKPKTTYKHIDLPINEETYSLTKKALDANFEKETEMILKDRLEMEKADAKNSVEEYVYEMRDRLETRYSQYISEEDKATFSSLLDATEDWLYDEGEDQPKKVYVERLSELKKHGDPIAEREKEHQQRGPMFDHLGQTIIHYEKILNEYSQGDEKYNHLLEADMEKVKEAVIAKREWLNAKMQAQQTTPLTVDPPTKVSEIKMTTKNLTATCNPIVTKPKPKVEPPKDEQPPPATEGEGPGEEEEQQEKMEETEATPTETEAPPTVDDMDVD